MYQEKISKPIKPLIYLLRNPLGYYMYDTGVNLIVKIDEDVYTYLNGLIEGKEMECSEKVTHHIEKLKEKSFLSDNRVKEIKHQNTDLLDGLMDNNMGQLILQVTRNCNLRCSYCSFANNTEVETRKHSHESMSFEIAKRSIDMYYNNSKYTKDISIGFYGGEPLLEINLIKKCVMYAEQIFKGRKIVFNMTTNGTLLTINVLSFLCEHDFNILVSLDGDKESHDKNRKFESGKGSFDIIINNIQMAKEKFPEYYRRKIRYNVVMDGENDFNCMDLYFSKSPLFSEIDIQSTFIDDKLLENKNIISASFNERYYYEVFKLFLSYLNRYPREKTSYMVRSYITSIVPIAISYGRSQMIPETMHHSGPCTPVKQKLFINVNGEFFPCEKANEANDFFKIGNIDDGFNEIKIKNLLNIGELSSEKCKNCWQIKTCRICAVYAEGISGVTEKTKTERCLQQSIDFEWIVNDYIVLKHYGYDYAYNSKGGDQI